METLRCRLPEQSPPVPRGLAAANRQVGSGVDAAIFETPLFGTDVTLDDLITFGGKIYDTGKEGYDLVMKTGWI